MKEQDLLEALVAVKAKKTPSDLAPGAYWQLANEGYLTQTGADIMNPSHYELTELGAETLPRPIFAKFRTGDTLKLSAPDGARTLIIVREVDLEGHRMTFTSPVGGRLNDNTWATWRGGVQGWKLRRTQKRSLKIEKTHGGYTLKRGKDEILLNAAELIELRAEIDKHA
jgi:hypothetical protein